MKRALPFLLVVAVGVTALVVSQVRRPDAPVSPRTLLYFIADTEKELSRVPARATRLSDSDEIAAGDQLAAAYLRQMPQPSTEADREMQSYIARIGGRVSGGAQRKLPYRFHYIPDPGFVNAFALPGGHVFIGGGLIRLIDSEDELAAVLGHEIEHVDRYHCAERVQVESRMRRLGSMGALAQLPIEVFQAGYSKDQELEADREGTRIAVQAGYSPYAPIRLFEKFQRLRGVQQTAAHTPQQEASRLAMETLSGYFRSHPLESERIAQLRQMIVANHWPEVSERPLAVGLANVRTDSESGPGRILR